jgi:ribosomal protein S18 acetylase RimI-like enzyme
MNPRHAPLLRIARPTRDLVAAREFYTSGLGLQVLFAFQDHEGFDGVILGSPSWPYELEFTRDRRAPAVPHTTEEDLLVFYLPDPVEWGAAVRRLRQLGAREVSPSNPYWQRGAVTFEDPDGYRLALYSRSEPSEEPTARALDVQQPVTVIRPYHHLDEAVCRACVVELQDAERGLDHRLRAGESMADEYLAQMHSNCQKYDGAILVAERLGEVAGLVMVVAHVPFEALDDPPGDYALVAELVVRRAFRRMGIGRALLEAAERFARDAGAPELSIIVLSQNTPARSLYLREGFTPYKETLTKSLRA